MPRRAGNRRESHNWSCSAVPSSRGPLDSEDRRRKRARRVRREGGSNAAVGARVLTRPSTWQPGRSGRWPGCAGRCVQLCPTACARRRRRNRLLPAPRTAAARAAPGSDRHGDAPHAGAGGRACWRVGGERRRAGGERCHGPRFARHPGAGRRRVPVRRRASPVHGADHPRHRRVRRADAQLHHFEQSPVEGFVGNSPIDGYFQLDDLKQVEGLRGPQGTLYGAGTLAGALTTDVQLPAAQYLLRRGRGEWRPARALGRHAVRAEGPAECAAGGRAGVPRIGEVRYEPGSSTPTASSCAPTMASRASRCSRIRPSR